MIYFLAAMLLLSPNLYARELEISGAREGDIKKIRTDHPSAFEDQPSLDVVDDIIRFLTATNNYDRVLAETDQSGSIRIVAAPLRTIRQIVIKGQDELSEREILKILGLTPMTRFDRRRVLEAGERLKTHYANEGFINAVIEINFGRESNQSVILEFKIDEKTPCRITRATIQSLNIPLQERLERFTYRLKGRALASDRVQDFRNRVLEFLQDNRYLKAELLGPEVKYNQDKSRAELVFQISDPLRYEFIPEGFTRLNVSEIYQQLNPDTIERGSLDPGAEAAERLKQGYLNRGFPNVEVNVKTVDFKADFIRRVILSINEGQRVRIKDIQFSGRMGRPNRYYAKFLRSNGSHIIARGFYNRRDYEKGYDNLINELRNQGFLHAKIQSSRLEYLGSPDQARLLIVMDEGPLTQLSTITFNGAQSFTSATLADAISLKANVPLKLPDLEKSLEELRTFYRANGYLEFRILNEGQDIIEYNDRGTQANVKFDIYEGPKVTVASIQVEGNTFTDENVVRRSLDIAVGDTLTPARIEESELRLNRLSIFGRVSIHTLEDGTTVSQRNVIVSVVERDPGTFRVGAGVSSERSLTARGFLGLAYNNLYGTGRAVSGRAEIKSHIIEVNYPQYEVVAGYLEPFLLESRSKGRVNLTRSERIFLFNKKHNETEITTSTKLDLFVERDFNRNWRLIWKAWSLDYRNEFERYGRRVPDAKEEFDPNSTATPNNQQIATIGPLLYADFRNDPFSPTAGHHSTWTLEYSDPYIGSSSGLQFVHTELGHSHYFPIKSGWNFSTVLRGGYVSNLSHDRTSGVPASKAFFLGGQSTIRGFQGSLEKLNERIPSGLQVSKSTELLIRTDSHYVLTRNELMFPISGDHAGVIFYDGGLVKISGYNLPRPYRDSIGIGYRYKTPVGPVALDLGFKISPRQELESPMEFHFYLGAF
jgi:outer membrane protein insertion porin family